MVSPFSLGSHSHDGGQVAEDVPSFLPATRKFLDHPALISKNSVNGLWCVAKDGVPDSQLQSNIDFACSNGADCGPINAGGACFEPNTVRAHASYAMNSYFQANGQTVDACNFDGTGVTTDQDPTRPDKINRNFQGGDEVGPAASVISSPPMSPSPSPSPSPFSRTFFSTSDAPQSALSILCDLPSPVRPYIRSIIVAPPPSDASPPPPSSPSEPPQLSPMNRAER
ncbi:hypothetical protein BT93_D1273 [Corymbia citriodora subsp. variegata]|nr:hypothetical protein BT93_D1273 [Corymbia citriodora subsp. variegata]